MTERKLLKTLLTAAASLSTMIHELEAQGVKLSTSQDNRWGLASIAIETTREHLKKEKD